MLQEGAELCPRLQLLCSAQRLPCISWAEGRGRGGEVSSIPCQHMLVALALPAAKPEALGRAILALNLAHLQAAFKNMTGQWFLEQHKAVSRARSLAKLSCSSSQWRPPDVSKVLWQGAGLGGNMEWRAGIWQ